MSLASRRSRRTIDIWPGYVDAMAALLMVVIFVLLVFVIAQAFLSRTVSEQDYRLTALQQQIAEITRQLGLAEEENAALRAKTDTLASLISELMGDKTDLDARVEQLVDENAGLQVALETSRTRITELEDDVGGLSGVRRELEARLAELGDSLTASSAENNALVGDREALETVLAQAVARSRGLQGELDTERELSREARAQLAVLNRQIALLRRQLAEIAAALEDAEQSKQVQAAEIEDLGRRLNIALAREVNRLKAYRSEFFGRLREVLGDSPDIRVVGDRFVFSSELLFASGTADLGNDGRAQLARLATTLRGVASRIPADIDWILRIDGHTDRAPISTAQFPSNWELSTARAVSVVRFLVAQGIASDRLVAAGFGEHHPLDPGESPLAYARNRRIEIKLTSR